MTGRPAFGETTTMKKSIEDKIVMQLKNHKLKMQDLVEITGESKQSIDATISELIAKGIPVDIQKELRGADLLYHINVYPNSDNVFVISDSDSKERDMHFGFVSDPHFGSIFHMSKTFSDSI